LRLFALQYLERGDKNRFVKRFKSADEFDLALFERAKREFQTLARTFSMITTFLNTAIPLEGREDPRPVNYGFHSYSDLFNARQLLCLASVLEAISSIENTAIQESLLLAFSDSLASNNMLCYYAFDYDKVTPLFGLHGYNMVTRPVENNGWGAPLGRGTFKNCVAKMLKGLRGMSSYDWSSVENKRAGNCFPELPASDSSDLPRPASTGRHYVDLRRASARQIQLPDNSIDLILTDPPYFDNLNYGEMSDFYYAWLRPILKNRYPQEFQPLNCVGMVDRIHGNGDQESLDRFRNGLVQVFSECNRVLREAGIMALTFHHKRREPWSALVEALNQAGFTVIQLVPLRSEGRSGFHSAPGNLKWDAVLVCRPSASGPCLCIETGKADAIHLLKKWERQLGKVVGGPSEEDWRSLGFAVDCFLNQSILRERLGNIPICSQGGES
jgi:adenine-specific DNA methylase